jgi:hypothetical protein
MKSPELDVYTFLRWRRLNYRLTEACEADIDALCTQECSLGAQACGGRVLRCLTDKQDSIKSKVRGGVEPCSHACVCHSVRQVATSLGQSLDAFLQ